MPTGFSAGAAIRKLRTNAGMSRRALSQRSGLSDAYVGKVESGAIDPSLRRFARLALALNMTPGELHVVIAHEGHAELRGPTSANGNGVTPSSYGPDQ